MMQYLLYTFINDAIFTNLIYDARFIQTHAWFDNPYAVQYLNGLYRMDLCVIFTNDAVCHTFFYVNDAIFGSLHKMQFI